METKIVASLYVKGDSRFDPDRVFEELGLQADEIVRLGERMGSSHLVSKANKWILTSEYVEGIDMDDCMRILMQKIDSNWDKLLVLCSRKDVTVQLYVGVLHCESDDVSFPSLGLSADAVRKLSALNASVDIDVILCA